jgi:hypothetical protein
VRILLTGSREWTDEKTIRQALTERYNPDAVLVHGACPQGADAIADRIWRQLGGTPERHPADWRTYGLAAGGIRNAHMVKLGADICLAFRLDGSPGTGDCMRRARKAGIPVEPWLATSDGQESLL